MQYVNLLCRVLLAFSDSGSDDRQRALENRKRTALKVEELDKDVLRYGMALFIEVKK